MKAAQLAAAHDVSLSFPEADLTVVGIVAFPGFLGLGRGFSMALQLQSPGPHVSVILDRRPRTKKENPPEAALPNKTQ